MFSKIINQLTRLAGFKRKIAVASESNSKPSDIAVANQMIGVITQPTEMIGTGYYYFTLSKQDSSGNVLTFRFQYSEINSQNFLKQCRVTYISTSNEVIQVTNIEFL